MSFRKKGRRQSGDIRYFRRIHLKPTERLELVARNPRTNVLDRKVVDGRDWSEFEVAVRRKPRPRVVRVLQVSD